jgi:hypothetical protein
LIGEIEPLGPTDPNYLTEVRKAITAANGQTLRTVGDRVVKIEGSDPPANLN